MWYYYIIIINIKYFISHFISFLIILIWISIYFIWKLRSLFLITTISHTLWFIWIIIILIWHKTPFRLFLIWINTLIISNFFNIYLLIFWITIITWRHNHFFISLLTSFVGSLNALYCFRFLFMNLIFWLI